MAAPEDYFTAPTRDQIAALIASFAASADPPLQLDSWQAGDPAEQLYQAFIQAIILYTGYSAVIARGLFLDYATDPGDPDPYDPDNELLDPEPGFLSTLGLNYFFTQRPGATLATTNVTFNNTSGTPYTFKPFDLTRAQSGDPSKTYRNAADDSIYTGAGGTYTLAAGATVDLPVVAETAGTSFNAAPTEIDTLVTGLIGVTVTNASPAIGTDRMPADQYRSLCRARAGLISPGGAADAYRYLSTTLPDGTPLLRNDGSEVPVGITRVAVSSDSAIGAVDVYYADEDGAADATDVATANANIELYGVPDAVTFTGAAAGETSITVTWAVFYVTKLGGKTIAGADVKAAIVAALTARFQSYPIGGYDISGPNGTIYLEDIRATVKGAHPAIYNATLSSPAGDTSIPIANVAVLNSPTGTETGS